MYLKNNFIYFYNYKIKCSIGKRGLTDRKKEGDFKTPKETLNSSFYYIEKIELKNSMQNNKKKLKETWVGVMIQVQKNITS